MKRFLFVLSLLFMASIASAQVYEGDRMYFLQSGGRDWLANVNKVIWDMNFTHGGSYPDITYSSGTSQGRFVSLPCPGEYYISLHTTYSSAITIYFDSNNDGYENEHISLTKTDLGGGTYLYTGSFDAYTGYVSVQTAFGLGFHNYYDSYIELVDMFPIVPIVSESRLIYEGVNYPIRYTKSPNYWTHNFQLYSDIVSKKSGYYGDDFDLDYFFCGDVVGLQWVVCTDEFIDPEGRDIDMRSCGFWVNVTVNPEKQFVTVPQANLGDTFSVPPGVALNFSLAVFGMDYDIITWDIFQAGTDHIVDYAEGMYYSFLGDSLGVDSGFYLVEATVTDLCGGVAYTAQWQLHIEGECGRVSGVVTRSNSTDIWDIVNGSISFGGHYSDIVNGSYNLSLEEGCYSVYVQDYDLEGYDAEAGFFESVCVVPWSVRNFNLPYTVANQTLTVCLFSNTSGAVVGRLLSLTSGGVFQSSVFSNASGCVVWGGLHYLTMYYIPSTYNSTVYCEGVFTDMQGDQFRNISCYDSVVAEALSFSVSDISSGDPVENARVLCGFVYGFTDAFGWVSLTLQEGLDYNCSVSADFYSPYPLVFNNLSASDTEQAVDVRLSPLGTVRDVQFWSWEEVSDLTYIPLEGVEFTLEGVDSDFSETYDSGTGYFVVSLLDGRYRLSGVCSGYAYVLGLSDGGLITVDNNHHYFELFFRESSFGGGGGDMTELNTPDAMVAFGWAYLPFVLFLLIFVLAGTTIIRSVRDAGLW